MCKENKNIDGKDLSRFTVGSKWISESGRIYAIEKHENDYGFSFVEQRFGTTCRYSADFIAEDIDRLEPLKFSLKEIIEQCKKHFGSPYGIANEIIRVLQSHGKLNFVAHNAEFDYNFLFVFLQRFAKKSIYKYFDKSDLHKGFGKGKDART